MSKFRDRIDALVDDTKLIAKAYDETGENPIVSLPYREGALIFVEDVDAYAKRVWSSSA